MPEEVTELYQDPTKFLKNLGLEFAVDNDVVRDVYEQQHTQKIEIQAHFKNKEINASNWDINLMEHSKLKSLFNERMVKSKLTGVSSVVDDSLYFFIDLPKIGKKSLPRFQHGIFFSETDLGFSNQFIGEFLIDGNSQIIRRAVEFDLKDLLKLKKFTLVFCVDQKPKALINNEIYYENDEDEKKDLELYDKLEKKAGFIKNKIHTLMLLDNPVFDKELSKEVLLQVSWASMIRFYHVHVSLLRRSIIEMEKLINYFDNQIKNSNDEMLPSWHLAKQITIECVKAKKSTEIPEIFHKIYTDEKNRKILTGIFYNTSIATNTLLQGLSFFFNFYIFSEVHTDYGLKMPSLELVEPYEIKSYVIDYRNLPELSALGSDLDSVMTYWKAFANTVNSNRQYNANMHDVLEPFDYPIDVRFYKQIFGDIDISDSEEDVEKLCESLLEEANASKNWVMNNGSFFALKIENFIGVQLFEKFEDIEAKFITKDNFFYSFSLNVDLIKTNSDPGLIHVFGKEKANRILLALKQIICALVRDFWVVERKESLFDQTEVKNYLPRKYNQSDKPFRVVYLPKVIYERKTNKPSTNCFKNLDYAKRSKHAVRAFIRVSDTISPLQKFLAQKYKFDVPEGYTFVQPHYRGETKEQKIIYRSRSAMQMIYEKKVDSKNKQNRYFQFEIDVKKYLQKLKLDVKHYAANRRNDGGVDIIATKTFRDKQLTYLVQCKCYKPKNKIGPSIVRELVGSMMAYGDECKGIIITTSKFTSDAESERKNFLSKGLDIEFIDGTKFASETL